MFSKFRPFPQKSRFALLLKIKTAVSEFEAMNLAGCDLIHSVDVSEIRRAPVEVGRLSPVFTGFYTSQVVQDFFHRSRLGHRILHLYTHIVFFLAQASPARNDEYKRYALQKKGVCRLQIQRWLAED